MSQTIELLLFVGIGFYLLALAETGFRVGIRLHLSNAVAEPRARQFATVQEALLILVSLMLGFTFAMALERYNTRRELVIKEANAIGTTFLRASMLPDPYKAPVRDALRRYTELKLRGERMYGGDTEAIAAGSPAISQIQNELWRHATASAKIQQNAITQTFIETLNGLIDVDEERLEEGRVGVPGGVWVMLVIVAGFGCLVTGFRAGAEGVRTALANVLLPALITIVIVIILDVAHPLHGTISISQQPLVDVQNFMAGWKD